MLHLWYTDFTDNTDFLKGLSVQIAEIRVIRVQKKWLRNSL